MEAFDFVVRLRSVDLCELVGRFTKRGVESTRAVAGTGIDEHAQHSDAPRPVELVCALPESWAVAPFSSVRISE